MRWDVGGWEAAEEVPGEVLGLEGGVQGGGEDPELGEDWWWWRGYLQCGVKLSVGSHGERIDDDTKVRL